MVGVHGPFLPLDVKHGRVAEAEPGRGLILGSSHGAYTPCQIRLAAGASLLPMVNGIQRGKATCPLWPLHLLGGWARGNINKSMSGPIEVIETTVDAAVDVAVTAVEGAMDILDSIFE